MPDSIVIGGVGLRLVAFQERSRTYRGEAVRNFKNGLMDGRDSPKRTWDGTTYAMLPEDEAELRTAIDAGPVVCSGLVLYGESVLCTVTVENAPRGPDVLSGGTTNYTAVNSSLSLVIQEE